MDLSESQNLRNYIFLMPPLRMRLPSLIWIIDFDRDKILRNFSKNCRGSQVQSTIQ